MGTLTRRQMLGGAASLPVAVAVAPVCAALGCPVSATDKALNMTATEVLARDLDLLVNRPVVLGPDGMPSHFLRSFQDASAILEALPVPSNGRKVYDPETGCIIDG